jgi:hypothetical protein
VCTTPTWLQCVSERAIHVELGRTHMQPGYPRRRPKLSFEPSPSRTRTRAFKEWNRKKNRIHDAFRQLSRRVPFVATVSFSTACVDDFSCTWPNRLRSRPAVIKWVELCWIGISNRFTAVAATRKMHATLARGFLTSPAHQCGRLISSPVPRSRNQSTESEERDSSDAHIPPLRRRRWVTSNLPSPHTGQAASQAPSLINSTQIAFKSPSAAVFTLRTLQKYRTEFCCIHKRLHRSHRHKSRIYGGWG